VELLSKNTVLSRFTALALGASVALVSCSGGGGAAPIVPSPVTSPGPSGGAGIASITGTIQLPAGSRLAVSSLRVSNSLGQVRVSMGGGFTVPAFGGPQLAQVTDANGTPVMEGFLSASEPAIDAHTTAEALVYFAGGFFLLPSDLQQTAYGKIAGAPGFPAVEAAVTADIAAGNGFATTGAALAAFVASLNASGTAPRAPGGAAPADLLVDPSGAQSGITVLNATPVDVNFRNTLRRMALAYVDQVSYGMTNGGSVTIVPAVRTDVVPPAIPIDASLNPASAWTALAACAVPCIPASTPLKSFNGTIVDLLYGNSAFAEVATPDLTLPSVAGAAWTRYRVTLVGPGGGGSHTSVPLSPEQAAGQQLVSTYFLMTQFLVPLITGVLLPIGSNLTDAPDPKAQAAVLADVISTFAADPDVAVPAASGDIGLALTRALTAIASTPTLRTLVVNAILKYAYTDGKLYFDGTGYLNSATVAEEFAGTLMRTTGAADILLQGFDASVVGHALAASNSADEVTVYAVPAKVTLSPSTSTIDNDAGVHLTASIPSAGGSDLALTYAWRNTAAYGHFKDLRGTSGVDNFTSTQNEGIYTANHTGAGTDTVSVTVVALDSSGNMIEHIPLGSGSATVSIATPDPGSVGDPPQNLPQSRCATMALAPHVVSVGGSFTGTASAPHPESCGGGTVTWNWSTAGGVSIVSGCGPTETSCTLKGTNPTGLPGNRYVQLCLRGSSTQGAWTSCDYYAVKP
jgi:hypothetical protein